MDYNKIFVLYYSILGIDMNDVNLVEYEKLIDLCQNYIVLEHNYLPETCHDLESEMQLFIWTLALEFTNDLDRLQYYNAVLGLLNITTQLNLIPEDSEDYILHFKRLNSIIINILYGINRLPKDVIINLWNVINNGDEKTRYRYILQLIFETDAICFKPILLAMYGTEANKDYRIFDKDSHIIDYPKLCRVLSKSVKTVFDIDLKSDYSRFQRPTYKECLELTRLHH